MTFLLAQGRADRSGLAPRTVQHVHAVLLQSLGVAERWGRVARNVAALVDAPRVPSRQRTPLSYAAARALLAAVQGHRLATLYALALILGLRLGELLGLRWADLDWTAQTLAVTQQVQATRGKAQIGPPKTEAGRRMLPLPAPLVALLREHLERQQRERAGQGAAWEDHGLIFPSERGTPLAPRNLERHYYAARAQAGIPETVNFHLVRHTVATWLAELGINETVIAAILGHSRQGVTALYTHVTQAAMRRGLEAIAKEVLAE